MNMEQKVIEELSKDLGIELRDAPTIEAFTLALSRHIDWLVQHDFNRLLSILYRVDVSEKLLKEKLREHPGEASLIIARLLIERQLQKNVSKGKPGATGNIPEDERW